MEKLDNQQCPVCGKNALSLTESQIEVPYFGKLYVFSMTCFDCKYHKADVETIEHHEPSKYTFEIGSEKDMNVRVVRSSQATVKIPHLMAIEPGTAANGYVTNVEGILNRMKSALETARDDAEDEEDRKKAKNLLKKIIDIKWGKEKVKLIIEDPSGNSAIVSDKAEKTVLKVKPVEKAE
jgi:zinc finger protein